MSFYIGKDNNGDAILHITNGVTPQSSIKSTVLANTQFHSSLPYLEVEEYKMINVSSTRLEAPIAFLNALTYTNPYFLIVDGKLQTIAMGLFMYLWNNGNASTTSSTPSNTYKYIDKPNTGDCYVYIIKNILNRNYVPFAPINNEIIKNGTSIIVRGKNLLNVKYIQNAVINAVDTQFYTDQLTTSENRKIQIVNSRATGSLGIQSNPSESSIIRGEHRIFSSLYNTKSKYKEKTPQRFAGDVGTTPVFYGSCGQSGTYVAPQDSFGIIGSGFEPGDLFVLDWIPSATPIDGIYDAQLFQYKEGFIGVCTLVQEFIGGWYIDAHTVCGEVDDTHRGSCSWTWTVPYGDTCEDFEGLGEVCGTCYDSNYASIQIHAEFVLEGHNGDIEVKCNSRYGFTSASCRCDFNIMYGYAIQVTYYLYSSILKFY